MLGYRDESEVSADLARAVEAAATKSREAADTIAELDASTIQIGTGVKLMTGIAAQTNLLVLNATIEAARAGRCRPRFRGRRERGKGARQRDGPAHPGDRDPDQRDPRPDRRCGPEHRRDRHDRHCPGSDAVRRRRPGPRVGP